jgi:hypothetical protein
MELVALTTNIIFLSRFDSLIKKNPKNFASSDGTRKDCFFGAYAAPKFSLNYSSDLIINDFLVLYLDLEELSRITFHSFDNRLL